MSLKSELCDNTGVMMSHDDIAGCGEHLVRTFLAKECGKALATSSRDLALQNLQRVMKEKFAESVFLTGVPEKLGGAICLQVDTKQRFYEL